MTTKAPTRGFFSSTCSLKMLGNGMLTGNDSRQQLFLNQRGVTMVMVNPCNESFMVALEQAVSLTGLDFPKKAVTVSVEKDGGCLVSIIDVSSRDWRSITVIRSGTAATDRVPQRIQQLLPYEYTGNEFVFQNRKVEGGAGNSFKWVLWDPAKRKPKKIADKVISAEYHAVI